MLKNLDPILANYPIDNVTKVTDSQTADDFAAIRKEVLLRSRDEDWIRTEVCSMRERMRNEHGDVKPLKHGRGGLLDIEFVVQMGLLLNAQKHPKVLRSTKVSKQLQALHECGWINKNTLRILDSAYARLSQVRLQSALIDDSIELEAASVLGTTQALCEEILG